MKLAYQDLINFLADKPSKEVLSKKLFQLGHEHEIKGNILDMELTPNRGDCLSLKGLSRDLNIFFGNSRPVEVYEEKIDPLEINFVNLSPKDCPKISFLEIEIENIPTEYKSYLENYFTLLGNNKTNFFTDISNYISYELGQPTHCFNRDAINYKLEFENKACKTSFKTLLGSEVKLEGRNCVFSMNNEIISLAGVMGGESTSCSANTKKVLIECAYFNPESIIGKSIDYNLISDAAHKFERGVDIGAQENVLRRFIKIVSDHTKIKSIKLKSFTSEEIEENFIAIDLNEITKILGIELTRDEYFNYLKSFGFEINKKIKVPSFRSDIKNQNDLAEEIARAIGYNNIKNTPLNLEKISENNHASKISKLESFLTKNGFSEVINFPFSFEDSKESFSLDNPIDSNKKNLRTSLKQSLIENLLYNERRQKDSIRLFEISEIYKKHSNIKKQKVLGLIVSGRQGNNYIDFSKKLDHKYLNKLLNEKLENDFFDIYEIDRSDLETKRKDKIFYVEVDLDKIPEKFFSDFEVETKPFNFIDYKKISDYPSSTRDFSFSISSTQRIDEVIRYFDEVSNDIIKDSFIFDFYNNKKNNTVKLGYRIILQSKTKTLSEEEITSIVQKIIEPILEMDGVTIPGMKLKRHNKD